LTTLDGQLEWISLQDVQIIKINRDPTHDDYVVTIHYKYFNPIRMHNYPLAQAKDLFPTLIAWHIHVTSGSNTTDPKLCWEVDHWTSITMPNRLENDSHMQLDLNILSNLGTHVSNNKNQINSFNY
jgi:hypothetical protein